eukprot:SAG22_NODE_6072_length_905_cov_1.245658_1_plen_149_part_00
MWPSNGLVLGQTDVEVAEKRDQCAPGAAPNGHLRLLAGSCAGRLRPVRSHWGRRRRALRSEVVRTGSGTEGGQPFAAAGSIMSDADMEIVDDDAPASGGGGGHSKAAAAGTPALIIYHLFEDPSYFDAWGAKGVPFRLAVRSHTLHLP